MGSKTNYDDIYERNMELANKVLKEYSSEEAAWKKFYKEFYRDPDGYRIKEKNGITCTADALFSAWRIYNHEGFNEKFIETYKQYRKEPIFFFPREQGGINQSRAAFFGDRIDHFLFDLKQYCEGSQNSKLKDVYQKHKTKEWLESFGKVNGRPSFSEIADWYQIVGVFVNADYEVFDLEKNDESVISNYCKKYTPNWTDKYYNNLKVKIDKFMISTIGK